jgi:hypothetical protein
MDIPIHLHLLAAQKRHPLKNPHNQHGNLTLDGIDSIKPAIDLPSSSSI